MRSEMAQPCCGSSATVFKIRRSRVPCGRSMCGSAMFPLRFYRGMVSPLLSKRKRKQKLVPLDAKRLDRRLGQFLELQFADLPVFPPSLAHPPPYHQQNDEQSQRSPLPFQCPGHNAAEDRDVEYDCHAIYQKSLDEGPPSGQIRRSERNLFETDEQ